MGEEPGNEFLFKFLIPAPEKGSPAPPGAGEQ